MVKERPLTINLHNPTDTIIWQFVLLTIGPFVFYANLFHDPSGYWNFSLIAWTLLGYFLLRPRPLILTKTTIKIPQERFEKHSLQAIKKLELTDDSFLKIEITDKYESSTKSLNLRYLSKEDANLLWLWIAKHLSHAQIDAQTREDLLNWQQHRTLASYQIKKEETSDNLPNENTQLELTFTPQSLMSASPGRKSLLFKIFGQLWLTLCFVLATVIFGFITTPSTNHGLTLNQVLLYYIAAQTPIFLFQICQPEALGAIALTIAILLTIFYLIRQIRPNSLYIDHLGLTLQYRQLVSRETEAYSTIFHSHIPWLAIGSIKLCKELPLSAAPDCLRFDRTDGKSSLRLPLNFMRTKKEKQRLLTLLQKYQKNHDFLIDQLVLDSLKDTGNYIPEYTQLWLNGLHQQQETALDTSSQATMQVEHQKLEIIQEIASGGQAMTYRAVKKRSADETNDENEAEADADAKQTLEEQVVLKEFFLPTKNETIYKTQVAKFKTAAALLKTLHHPNLVRVDSYFVDGPKACLLLEYIQGTTLAQSVIREGILCETKAINLALSMCDILTYLHGQIPPLLHLDFTPDNLILDKESQLKLIDLDSCLVHSDHTAQRQYSNSAKNRTVIGKQCYIPREQFQGQADNRSDIFALGATLFYLTTLRKPEPFAALHPRKYNEALSEGFDAIVAKAAAVLADERYDSAEELKREFLLLKGSLEADGVIKTSPDMPTTIITQTKENKEIL